MNPTTLAQAAFPFEWHKKTYQIGVADYELELYFQARHEAWIRNRIEAISGMISQDAYRVDVDVFAKQRDANLFAFGSQLSMQWLVSDDGFIEYALLLSGKGKKEQGGAVFSKEALRGMKRTDKDSWDLLTKLVIERDFPNLLRPAAEAPSDREQPSITDESFNSSVETPGSWAESKSSGSPTITSAT